MSVYMRFFVKTKYPRQVEQIIIDTLGGIAWLEPNAKGAFLHPLSVISEEQRTVQPARDFCGNYVDLNSDAVIGGDSHPKGAGIWSAIAQLWRRPSDVVEPMEIESEDARWYWLPSIIDYGSIEASWVAHALYKSPLVDVVAENNDISADMGDGLAEVIDSEHSFMKGELPFGPPR
ncbi:MULTISPECIES: hypothetical protein [Pseudomonas]|uniref:hypothetical protein n=1 Tax=Pseudomonas TaxID=286 RepID=UPI00059AE62A|nr:MULTISPECIES: hypothetical protein [Pseudomonas]MCC9289426.1 hypothetical protein [Pseudomonas aeruginosa]